MHKYGSFRAALKSINASWSAGGQAFARKVTAAATMRVIKHVSLVPCILCVNRTDVDLLEFIQQLADTDGSSIVPPSVNRVLNNKACRMSSWVINFCPSFATLGALHEQIAELSSWSRSSSEAWHGLHRH